MDRASVGIPQLMATQHPDSTKAITAEEEVEEAIQAFTPVERGGYGCDEVMVDYEGKATPYHQPRLIIQEAVRLGLPMGSQLLITPRVPNPVLEDADRTFLAISSSLLANRVSLARAGHPAVSYFVLPMAENPMDVAYVYRLLSKISNVVREELGGVSQSPVNIIPLFEDVYRHLKIDELLDSVRSLLIKELGVFLDSFRVFLGKSDSAVKYGHLASAMAMRMALVKLHEWSRLRLVSVFPIVGVGAPPFRGGLNATEVGSFVEAYRGYRTVTVQSALRYDIPRETYLEVRKVLMGSGTLQPDTDVLSSEREIIEAIKLLASSYASSMEKAIGKLQPYMQLVPTTRDRVEWTEYGRRMEEAWRITGREVFINVPRAVQYASTWYLVGLPPALLDLPGIMELEKRGLLDIVLRTYPRVVEDLKFDLKFSDLEIAKRRLGAELVGEVERGLDMLGLKPEKDEEHSRMIDELLDERFVLKAAKMRGFLG